MKREYNNPNHMIYKHNYFKKANLSILILSCMQNNTKNVLI
jgi:hypothetical protein